MIFFKKLLLSVFTTSLLLFATNQIWLTKRISIQFLSNTVSGSGSIVYLNKQNIEKSIPIQVSENEVINERIKDSIIKDIKLVLPNGIFKLIVKGSENFILNQNDFNIKEYENTNTYSLQREFNGKYHIDFYYAFLILIGCFYSFFSYKNKIEKNNIKVVPIKNIEFLRILFTISVVFGHSCGYFDIWSAGQVRVEFFFVLSGFFLVKTFKNNCSFKTYAIQKYIRFIPLIFFGEFLCKGGFGTFKSLLLVQGTGFAPFDFIKNGLTWYMNVLFWISILYYVMLKHLSSKIRNILVGVMVVALFPVENLRHAPPVFPFQYMCRGLFGVGLGYFLAILIPNNIDRSERISVRHSILEVIIFTFILLALFNEKVYYIDQGIHSITFFLIIYLFVVNKGILSHFFEKDVCVHLAKYCLPTYLTHYWLMNWTFDPLTKIYPNILVEYRLLTFCLFPLLCWIFGVWTYHFVERPLTKFLIQKLK